MDNVTITATPANQANSTENGGTRIDGFDQAPINPIPPGRIFATEGWVRINVTVRHDIATMDDFGETAPFFFRLEGNAANYIRVFLSAVNQIRLEFNDGGGVHNANWAAAGLLVAGTRYLMEVQWDAAHMELRVDSIVRINIAQPVNFALVPIVWWPGSNQIGKFQIDAVFSSPA